MRQGGFQEKKTSISCRISDGASASVEVEAIGLEHLNAAVAASLGLGTSLHNSCQELETSPWLGYVMKLHTGNPLRYLLSMLKYSCQWPSHLLLVHVHHRVGIFFPYWLFQTSLKWSTNHAEQHEHLRAKSYKNLVKACEDAAMTRCECATPSNRFSTGDLVGTRWAATRCDRGHSVR